MSCCKWQIFSLKAFEDFFESTHYSGLLLQKAKVKRIHHAQTGEDAQRFTGSLPRIAAHLLKKMLEENIPSWDLNRSVRSELWHHGSSSENTLLPATWYLALAQTSYGITTRSCLIALIASSASEMQLQELLGHWEEGLRHFPSDCNSLTLLRLSPLPHTMQCGNNEMRSRHEVRSSFVRMTEILYSFMDDKKVISQMLPLNTSKELAVRGANWASLQRRSGAARQLLKMFPLPMEVPSAMKEATRQGKCTGKSHPENLTA